MLDGEGLGSARCSPTPATSAGLAVAHGSRGPLRSTGPRAPSQTRRHRETNHRLRLHFNDWRWENTAAPLAEGGNKPSRKGDQKWIRCSAREQKPVKTVSRRWHKQQTDSKTKENNTSLVRSFFWTLFKVWKGPNRFKMLPVKIILCGMQLILLGSCQLFPQKESDFSNQRSKSLWGEIYYMPEL